MGFLEGIGKVELIVIAVVLLILFGPKKLPEFARGVSEAIREITKVFKGEEESKKSDTKANKK